MEERGKGHLHRRPGQKTDQHDQHNGNDDEDETFRLRHVYG